VNHNRKANRNRFSLRAGLILAVAGSLVAVSACAGETAAPETAAPEAAASGIVVCPTVDISLGMVEAASEPVTIVLGEVGERISERTGGTLTLTIYPDGQLGQNRDMQEQTVAGGSQISRMDPGYAAEIAGNTEFNIMGGPFLFDTVEDLNWFIDSDLVAEWNQQFEEAANVKVLSWKYYFGERHILSDRGYPEPEDLRGIKVRVPPSPSWIATFEALPSTPTVLEWSELYSGLDQGVVDAGEAPLSALKASSLYEVGDTITLTGHFKAATGLFTNREFWDSLPTECQDVIMEEIEAGATEYTQITANNEMALRNEFEAEFGSTLVEANIPAYKEAAKGFYSAFPEWRPGLYEQVLEILESRP